MVSKIWIRQPTSDDDYKSRSELHRLLVTRLITTDNYASSKCQAHQCQLEHGVFMLCNSKIENSLIRKVICRHITHCLSLLLCTCQIYVQVIPGLLTLYPIVHRLLKCLNQQTRPKSVQIYPFGQANSHGLKQHG